MFAVRYSENIDSDIERGFSYCGWGLEPTDTEEECWDLIRRKGLDGAFPAYIEDAEDIYGQWGPKDGWLPARDGLCAIVGETREDAIENARNWGGMEWAGVYVFPCNLVGECDN